MIISAQKNVNVFSVFRSLQQSPGQTRGPPTGPPQPAHMSNPPPQPFPTPNAAPPGLARMGSKDEEDTMKNLRKTFAGIFGDM